MRFPATRIAAIAALVLGAAIVAAVFIGAGGGSYTLHTRFPDAGQVVKGGLVEVAGRNVGKIDRIELTDDGAADVVLKLDDDSITPLHEGTRAEIRAVGSASVANRFVELSPGPPNTPEIKDGGTLDMAHTRGIVDLDAVLDTFDEPTRKKLQGIVAELAGSLKGRTTGDINDALAYVNPALAQTSALGRELTLDQAALTQLVRAAATTSRTLAERPDALRGALAGTSRTLAQLAQRRAELGDALERTPVVLRKGTRTLRDLQATLPAIDPVLRKLRPAAPQIATLLRELVPVTRDALPTFAGVQALLPKANAALKPLPALSKEAVPALVEGAKALKDLTPVLAGLRPYTPDLLAGFFEGFGGSTSGYYDANGHMTRIAFNSNGLPGLLPQAGGSTRTGLLSRCPGAASEPADDGSNPYNPTPGTKDTCDEGQTPK